MIQFVTGDILLSEAEALVHGVAPNDNFKQGLALSLRERWPAMYKDFRHYCKTKSPKEGELWSWKGAGGPAIVNLMTQMPAPGNSSHPGKASLPNLNHCFKALIKEIENQGFKSIALTKVATGVGGLSWADVKPLIEESLSSLKIPVYVYETYQKDSKAKES